MRRFGTGKQGGRSGRGTRYPVRLGALLAAAALIATACGTSATPGASGAQGSAAGGAPIALTISANAVVGGKNDLTAEWITTYVIPTFQQMMAAQGKNVTVTFAGSGAADEDYKTQLGLDFKTGGGADVIVGLDDIWVGEFAEAGYIKPLNQVGGAAVDSWDGWSQISKAAQDDMSYNGQRFGIASGLDGRVLYFNKDVMAAAGLPADWQPKSWADILSAAQAIKTKEPGVTPLQINAGTAMGEATTAQGFLPLLVGTGVNIYDTTTKKWQGNTPQIQAVLSFYQQIYGSSGLGDPQIQLGAKGRDQSFQEFSKKKIGILLEGDYLWRSVINPTGGIDPEADRDTNVGWALIPAMNPGSGIKGQNFVSISGGGGSVLNPNTKSPNEAWDLLSFMSGKDAVTASVAKQVRITMRTDVNAATLAKDPLLTFVSTKVFPITAVRPGLAVYDQVSQLLQLASQDVVSGKTPAQAAAAYETALIKLVGADHIASGG
jgi:multiple sugar transport system substrate-binding protein